MLWPVAVQKLRDRVLYPDTQGTNGGSHPLPGWEFTSGQWIRFREVANKGGFAGLRLSADSRLSTVVGVFVVTITALADVLERELALHDLRLRDLEARVGRKQGAPSAEEVNERVERQRTLHTETALGLENEAPTTQTPLRGLRFRERIKERGAAMATERPEAVETAMDADPTA